MLAHNPQALYLIGCRNLDTRRFEWFRTYAVTIPLPGITIYIPAAKICAAVRLNEGKVGEAISTSPQNSAIW